MKIGVISDTHGYLNPTIFKIFKDVDFILHAGDVGNSNILTDLNTIAPTTAIFGNTDGYPLRGEISEREVIKTPHFSIGLSHGGGSPFDIIKRLKQAFGDPDIKLIIFGHTHKPEIKEIEGVMMFNPGDGRYTVGLIHVSPAGEIDADIKVI